jgi:hypothetical protein
MTTTHATPTSIAQPATRATPTRPPERILAGIVKAEGRGAKQRRKLAANRERNWLLALTLRSFARVAAGQPLSDLEATIVDAFRANGYSDRELAQQGRLYEQLPADVRRDLFPARFAGLAAQTPYTTRQLQADAPAIVQAVLAMPNVTRIDADAIHAGKSHLRELPPVGRDVQAQHGGAMLVALSSSATPPAPAAATSRYSIKATRFRCNEETGVDVFGADEPYWIFGALGGSNPVTSRSQTFEGVDSGDTFSFPALDGCIWGQSGTCAPQTMPEEVGVMVQLWEHDFGDPKAVQKAVAAAFAAAGSILTAAGVTAWIAAVVSAVGAVTDWLLGFLDDDHVADQVFAFSRAVIDEQLGKAGNTLEIVRRFTDGDGDYSLTLTVTRVA